MNIQKLIDEIKKLYQENEIITGFFNGNDFISDNNKIYKKEDLIIVNYNASKAFIVKYNNKWLCVPSIIENIETKTILNNKRKKRKKINNQKYYPFKLLFVEEKEVNNQIISYVYVGGFQENPILLFKTNIRLLFLPDVQYEIINLGKDKFKVNIINIFNNLEFTIIQCDENSCKINNSTNDNYINYLSYAFAKNGDLFTLGKSVNTTSNITVDGELCDTTYLDITTIDRSSNNYPIEFDYYKREYIVRTSIGGINEYCTARRIQELNITSKIPVGIKNFKKDYNLSIINNTFDLDSKANTDNDGITSINNLNSTANQPIYINRTTNQNLYYTNVSEQNLENSRNYNFKIDLIKSLKNDVKIYAEETRNSTYTYLYQISETLNDNFNYKLKLLTDNTEKNLNITSDYINLTLENPLNINIGETKVKSTVFSYFYMNGSITTYPQENVNLNITLNNKTTQYNYNNSNINLLSNQLKQLFTTQLINFLTSKEIKIEYSKDNKIYEAYGNITSVNILNVTDINAKIELTLNINNINEEKCNFKNLSLGELYLTNSLSFHQLILRPFNYVVISSNNNNTMLDKFILDSTTGTNISDFTGFDFIGFDYYRYYKLSNISLNCTSLIDKNIFQTGFDNNKINNVKSENIKWNANKYTISNDGDIIFNKKIVDNIYSLKSPNCKIVGISYHPNV